MNEDERKEASREWGEKYGREGESITNPNGVTQEFKEGYRKGAIGFGSNVIPRNFGKGRFQRPDWVCICGTENKKHWAKCPMCGVLYELAMEAHARA